MRFDGLMGRLGGHLMHRDSIELLVGATAIVLFGVALVVYQNLTACRAIVGHAVISMRTESVHTPNALQR
jgi:hypothetical protein